MIPKDSETSSETSALEALPEEHHRPSSGRTRGLRFVIDARLYKLYDGLLKYFVGSSNLQTTGLRDLKAFRCLKRVGF